MHIDTRNKTISHLIDYRQGHRKFFFQSKEMGASETIGTMGTMAVVLSILFVFTPAFTIGMDSYWADYWYPAGDDTATKAKHAGRKSSNWWTGYGILIFYVIAGCFNVASFYNTFYDSDNTGESSRSYTAGVALFITMIGLDKGIPVMLHYYSYKSLRNWCIFYGIVSWGITVCTIFVLGFNVSHLAAYLLIPYAAYNTSVNITGWVIFFGRADSTYDDSHGNSGPLRNTPAQPYAGNGRGRFPWESKVGTS